MKREGSLLIDHRASPGITEADVMRLRALGHNIPLVKEGATLELKTKSCAHCGVVVVLNPDRTRDRGYCSKCDKYTCDICAKLGDCRPIQALADAAVSDKRNSLLPPLILRSN